MFLPGRPISIPLGLGGLASFISSCRTSLAFLARVGASPLPVNCSAQAGLSRLAVFHGPCSLLHRADRLWPPFFRDLLVEPARAALSADLRRGPGLVRPA
jgi:hypothetical protein